MNIVLVKNVSLIGELRKLLSRKGFRIARATRKSIGSTCCNLERNEVFANTRAGKLTMWLFAWGMLANTKPAITRGDVIVAVIPRKGTKLPKRTEFVRGFPNKGLELPVLST